MIEVFSERLLSNDKVKRRYKVTITDLNGNNHEKVLGMFTHDKTDTGTQVEADYVESLKQNELQQYKTDIESGINPFVNRNLQFNDRETVLKFILDDALTMDATNPIVYNGLPYLSLVTDAELMALYSQTQTWVDDIRAKASSLLSAKAILDSHTGVL